MDDNFHPRMSLCHFEGGLDLIQGEGVGDKLFARDGTTGEHLKGEAVLPGHTPMGTGDTELLIVYQVAL